MNPLCPYCGEDLIEIARSVYKIYYQCLACKRFTEVEPAKPKKEYSLPSENLGSFSRSQEVISDEIDTSKQSLRQLQEEGEDVSQRKLVLAYIHAHPHSCIREVSEGLGIQKSSISARMNELKSEGKIIFTGVKEYSYKTVETWSIRSGTDIMTN